MTTKNEKIKVVELFAGVGGFRLGLEGHKGNKKAHHKHFETVWFNQWEPSTKRQHAHETYVERFGIDVESAEYTNIDIAKAVPFVPDHDLLVGGFPCQDYSVAKNLSAAGGLEGKKGVLWWSIYNILKTKGKKAPKYVMLENVDRLLTSPAPRRGRDFAIILSSLNELGYVVEWRVINAADYGMPQRRKRIFILAYQKGSNIYKQFKTVNDPVEWFAKAGAIQQSFPADVITGVREFTIDKDPVVVSETFNLEKPKLSPFANAGVCADYRVHTARVAPRYTGKYTTITDILIPEEEIPEEFFISKDHFKRWEYLKGSKNEERKAASGFEFIYKEGAVAFPEPLEKASRTIITSEGGPTPSRFKHVVKVGKRYRRLTPTELERLCMFPDHHTEGHSDVKRAFFLGNALVVGVIDGLGKALVKVDQL